MKRETVAGEASVKLLCATFNVSRQAYYAAKKGPTLAAKVVRLPVRPDVAPTAKVLEKIQLIIAENLAWGVRVDGSPNPTSFDSRGRAATRSTTARG